jgi:hypothetical protein
MGYVACPGCNTVFDPIRLCCPTCGRCQHCGERRRRGEEKCDKCGVAYGKDSGRCPICAGLRYGDVREPCACGFPNESTVRALFEKFGIPKQK